MNTSKVMSAEYLSCITIHAPDIIMWQIDMLFLKKKEALIHNFGISFHNFYVFGQNHFPHV